MNKILAFITLVFVDEILCNHVTVTTPVGEIRGTSVMTSFAGRPYRTMAFYGIPYAEPTDDVRRFSKPIKISPFNETYDATKPKTVCPEHMKWFPVPELLPESEDCLSLDVYVPHHRSNKQSKAVMIFIHGGAFQYGCKDVYKSEAFASANDVIYVTINYRLSAYGFLASTRHGLKGNYGLWDQHMAIQWVHDNIEGFGGDPKRVTLFGESAGAASVVYQALYDGNKDLIQRAIAQSGSVGAHWAYNENPDSAFEDLVAKTSCKGSSSEEIIQCLRSLNTSELQSFFSLETFFLPVYDGEFVKYNPKTLYKNDTMESVAALRRFADYDVIMGMNSDEGLLNLKILANLLGKDLKKLSEGITSEEFKLFTMSELEFVNFTDDVNVLNSLIHQYTNWMNPNDPVSRRSMLLDLLKDISYTPSVVQAANAHATYHGKGTIYMYQFQHRPSYSRSPSWIEGANHAEEIPFVLAFPSGFMSNIGLNSTNEEHITDDEMLLSINMMNFWTQFAKTGNPNDVKDEDPSTWPEYTFKNQTYIVLNTGRKPFSSGSHFRREFVNYWTNVYPGLQEVLGERRGNKSNCYKNSGIRAGSVMSLCVSCFLLLQTYMYPL